MIRFKSSKTYKPFEPFQFSRALVEARENLPNYNFSDNVTFWLNVNIAWFGKCRKVRRGVSRAAQSIWRVQNVRIFEWNFRTLQALRFVNGFLLNIVRLERFDSWKGKTVSMIWIHTNLFSTSSIDGKGGRVLQSINNNLKGLKYSF